MSTCRYVCLYQSMSLFASLSPRLPHLRWPSLRQGFNYCKPKTLHPTPQPKPPLSRPSTPPPATPGPRRWQTCAGSFVCTRHRQSICRIAWFALRPRRARWPPLRLRASSWNRRCREGEVERERQRDKNDRESERERERDCVHAAGIAGAERER